MSQSESEFHRKTDALIFKTLNSTKTPITTENVEAFRELCRHLNPLARIPNREAIQKQLPPVIRGPVPRTSEVRSTRSSVPVSNNFLCVFCQKSAPPNTPSIIIDAGQIYGVLTPLVYFEKMGIEEAKELMTMNIYRMCVEHVEDMHQMTIELKNEIDKVSCAPFPGYDIMKALVDENKARGMRGNLAGYNVQVYIKQFHNNYFGQYLECRRSEESTPPPPLIERHEGEEEEQLVDLEPTPSHFEERKVEDLLDMDLELTEPIEEVKPEKLNEQKPKELHLKLAPEPTHTGPVTRRSTGALKAPKLVLDPTPTRQTRRRTRNQNQIAQEAQEVQEPAVEATAPESELRPLLCEEEMDLELYQDPESSLGPSDPFPLQPIPQCIVCQKSIIRHPRVHVLEKADIYRILTPLIHYEVMDMETAKEMMQQMRPYKMCVEHFDEIHSLTEQLKQAIEAEESARIQGPPPGFEIMRELVEANRAAGMDNHSLCQIKAYTTTMRFKFLSQYLPGPNGSPPAHPTPSTSQGRCVVCESWPSPDTTMDIEPENILQLLTAITYYRYKQLDEARKYIQEEEKHVMCMEHIEYIHVMVSKLRVEIVQLERSKRHILPPGFKVMEALVVADRAARGTGTNCGQYMKIYFDEITTLYYQKHFKKSHYFQQKRIMERSDRSSEASTSSGGSSGASPLSLMPHRNPEMSVKEALIMSAIKAPANNQKKLFLPVKVIQRPGASSGQSGSNGQNRPTTSGASIPPARPMMKRYTDKPELGPCLKVPKIEESEIIEEDEFYD